MIDTDRQESIVHNQGSLDNLDVMVFGCGAIGSAVASILARMGVGRNGTLTLVDGDTVEDSNLNRQFFGSHHVGVNKALAVEEQLLEVDDDISVTVVPRYVMVDDFDAGDNDVIVAAADSLFVEGGIFSELQKQDFFENGGCMVSPRMNGYLSQLFTHYPAVEDGPDCGDDIYFSSSPDKDYGGDSSAHCTAGDIEEPESVAIATTTNFLSSLTAQAVLHYSQGWSFRPFFEINLKTFFDPSQELTPEDIEEIMAQ